MTSLLDMYEIRARLLPALLLIAALPIILITLGLREYPLVSGFAALFVAVGGPLILTSLVGEWGRKLDVKLFRDWGGPPTTSLLRVGNQSRLDPIRLQRRTRLEKAWGSALPSGGDEIKDPAAADEIYGSATAYLRERTRDHTAFPLVFAENCNFGFWRNLLALRLQGIMVSGIGCIVLIGAIIANVWVFDIAWPDLMVGLIVCALTLAFWLVFPTEQRVRKAAEVYAARLLDSTAIIAP